ncbi:MAG TPA: CocE/NonD family hydrolase [Steroidobacteraceae bacterium]|jgi:putative CocE/NonD family hydrolase|nr:CocE/NonD family hydrolase [Steroidobacteraceae bacterium]
MSMFFTRACAGRRCAGRRCAGLVSASIGCLLMATGGRALASDPLPNEIPPVFVPRVDGFDYVKREVMIPMRDGVKLQTIILIPRGAHRAPILLSRTPYGAAERLTKANSAHLSALIDSTDVADDAVVNGGYIRVMQDVRGKHGSEGDYVMTRPLRGRLNSTDVDHSTDTYDTIDWLVRNLPESNGKVGILGISYDGFTSLMALVNPHPALRAAVPINAMVDSWRGDDWFHNGAFRLDSLTYFHGQEANRASDLPWWTDHYDDYDTWLNVGAASDMVRLHGLEQVGFTDKVMKHPAYDAFWQEQALDKILAKQGVAVPVMLVHSLWDQEDIYGNIALYKALKAQRSDNPDLYLIIGPWFHHQQRLDGSAIGSIRFGSDTAEYFRLHLLRPFLDHYLKDDPPPLAITPVNAFETGTNRWRALTTWPSGCAAGCGIDHQNLYLQAGGNLRLGSSDAAASGFESYVSDPAKPVPYLPRPIHIGDEGEVSWQTWLVSDQRDAAARTDVLSFTTPVLHESVKISGEPIANLVASTTGTDGDFVVKLIDVYPDEVGREPKMGGYQLMIAADIFRGRYRESLSNPKAIPPDQKQLYRFALPTANHVFLPGHRIMVQVQSSWFPVYDRNPQSYVENIFFAKPIDYKKATIKIFAGGPNASFVDLPVVRAP